MRVLREKVRELVKDELVMANEQHGPFASDHEGFAVILEEAVEARDDMALIEKHVYRLMRKVFTDEQYDVTRRNVDDVEVYATELACEAIQIAAMCQKFRMSHKEVKE